MYCPICQKNGSHIVAWATDHLVSKNKFPLDQCPHCGFLRTGNKPSKDELGQYYQSEAYTPHNSYKKTALNRIYTIIRQFMFYKKHKLIKKNTLPNKSLRVLDIGCATGEFANYMKNKGCSVYGIEQSKEGRKYALEHFKIKSCAFLEELPPNEKEFNVITSWHVLEHIPNLEEHLKQIFSSLTKEGQLFLALPNPRSFDAEYYGENWAALDVPRHLWHFTAQDIQELARRHQFLLKKIYPLFWDAYYIALLSEKQKGNSIFTALLKALYIGTKTNIKTIKNPLKASSLLYVFTKKGE